MLLAPSLPYFAEEGARAMFQVDGYLVRVEPVEGRPLAHGVSPFATIGSSPPARRCDANESRPFDVAHPHHRRRDGVRTAGRCQSPVFATRERLDDLLERDQHAGLAHDRLLLARVVLTLGFGLGARDAFEEDRGLQLLGPPLSRVVSGERSCLRGLAADPDSQRQLRSLGLDDGKFLFTAVRFPVHPQSKRSLDVSCFVLAEHLDALLAPRGQEPNGLLRGARCQTIAMLGPG